jgi:hypothetical protein
VTRRSKIVSDERLMLSGNLNKTLFTITVEGDVVLGPDMNWTEAAEVFWAEVIRIAPEGRKVVRP